jgi:hypothetical protein
MNYQNELILEDVKYNINKLKKIIENFENIMIPNDDEIVEVKNDYPVYD